MNGLKLAVLGAKFIKINTIKMNLQRAFGVILPHRKVDLYGWVNEDYSFKYANLQILILRIRRI